MKHSAFLLTPLIVLALILGAIGCENKATPTPTTTKTAISTATPAPIQTATPTARPSPVATPTRGPTPTALPQPEGELNIALASLFGERFDPLTLSPTFAKTYLSTMYDYLVGATQDGDLSTETGIAKKWEHSADYTSWTFYLREGVKFHNGDDLTAEDVKFTLEQLGLPASTGQSAKPIYNNIKEMVVDGPYKIIVNLKSSNFFLDYQLSPVTQIEGMIRPKKYIQANGLDYFQKNPIGSGPYRLARYVPGSYIKLEALDYHFAQGVPKYKTITLYLAPEEITRIAMLKNGQVDIMDVTRQSVASLRKDGYNIFTSRLGDAVYLQLEAHVGESNPLSDKRVREALWLAINKQSILDNLFLGQGTLEGQAFLYPDVFGSVDLPPKPYDPERAKQLLKEAGYPEIFNNPTINIYSFARAGYSEGPAMMEAIAADWTKVGVKVKIIPSDLATWVGGLSAKKNVNSVTFQGFAPDKLFALQLAGQRSVPPGAFVFFTDPPDLGYDALLDQQAAAKTAQEYIAVASKIFRYVYENSRYLGLLRVKKVYATNQKIKAWDMGMYSLDFLNLRGLTTR